MEIVNADEFEETLEDPIEYKTYEQFRDRIEERDTPLSPRKPYPEYYHNLSIGKAGIELQFTMLC